MVLAYDLSHRGFFHHVTRVMHTKNNTGLLQIIQRPTKGWGEVDDNDWS
jgi:hypothetical protein